MSLEALCTIALPFLTGALVSALRKFLPSIDGKLLVFVAATVVGIGLSFVARYTLPDDSAATWIVVVRGAGAAALAFGAASWPRWAATVMRDVFANVQVTVPTSGDAVGSETERGKP